MVSPKTRDDWIEINQKIDNFLSRTEVFIPTDEREEFEQDKDDSKIHRNVETKNKDTFSHAVDCFIKAEYEKIKEPVEEFDDYHQKMKSRFKSYRKQNRCSETAAFNLKEFYNYLCSRESKIMPAQQLPPEDGHPFFSPGTVHFLRTASKNFDKEYAQQQKARLLQGGSVSKT